jgi:hypothetical protein
VIDGIDVKEESGERDDIKEKSYSADVRAERIDLDNVRLHVNVPANGREKKKLNVYVRSNSEKTAGRYKRLRLGKQRP